MRLSRLIPALTAAVVVILLAMFADRFLQSPAPTTDATVTVQSQPIVVSGAATVTAAAAEAGTTAEPIEEPGDAPGLTTFRIVPDESTAEFRIDETLGGRRATVVGTTHQVTGEIVTDLANPAATQLSEISVNARTLATDNANRNRAIANFILQTDRFEFITFRPTAIDGLAGGATVGQLTTFELVGDLTIRDVTRPVTFQVTVTPVSPTRLEGSATTTILRPDYNITIPDVPVAAVEEEVELVLNFVATP